jgi:hypothetical protein
MRADKPFIRIFIWNAEGRFWSRLEDNIKVDLKKMGHDNDLVSTGS